MAVPTIVKIPEPMTAPIPSEVRLSQPSDFFRWTSAPSQSEISWSMFLRRNKDEGNQTLRCSGKFGWAILPQEDRGFRFFHYSSPDGETWKRLCRFELSIALDEFFCSAT